MLSEAFCLEEGRKLLNIMGPAWELRVHYNFGWHYNLRSGGLSLSAHHYQGYSSHPATYYCLVGDRGTGYGEWHHSEGHKRNPIEAVESALRRAREVTDQRLRVVENAEAVLRITKAHRLAISHQTYPNVQESFLDLGT